MSFHEFNQFAGRLKESTRFQPLYPLNPSALDVTEPPKMIWDTIKTKPVAVSPPNARFASTVDSKMLEKFKHFQKDINKPVYNMGGPKDRIIFGISILIFSVCAVQTIDLFYKSFKKF